MNAVLRSKEGTITVELAFRELQDGTIEQIKTRHGVTRTSKKTTYPQASYAPMTPAEKLQELVNQAITAGFMAVELPTPSAETYSFMVEPPTALDQHLSDVVEAFGSVLHTDPANNVTIIAGTEFVVGSLKHPIRITAAVNVDDDADSDERLNLHFAIARCLDENADVFSSDGTKVDLKSRIVAANRSSRLSPKILECLYRFGILKRPIEIDASAHTGAYNVGF